MRGGRLPHRPYKRQLGAWEPRGRRGGNIPAVAAAAGRVGRTGRGFRAPHQTHSLPKHVSVNQRKALCVTTAMLVSGRCRQGHAGQQGRAGVAMEQQG